MALNLEKMILRNYIFSTNSLQRKTLQSYFAKCFMFISSFYLWNSTMALPFFDQLSTSGRDLLFRKNRFKAITLSICAYFFGFHGSTAIEQETHMYGSGNSTLQNVLEKYFPNHLNLKAFTYDSFFVSPWATSIEAEQKHKV